MRLLTYLNPSQQIHDLLGGSFNEIMAKVLVGIVAILWSIVSDTAYLFFIFLLLLLVDALLGSLLSRQKGRPFNGFFLFGGPGFKLIITSAVMVSMAILDNLIRSTPIGAIVTQPLTIGVGGAVCFAMGLDVVTKYAELSGNVWVIQKVRDMFGRMLPPVPPENKDPEPPTV